MARSASTYMCVVAGLSCPSHSAIRVISTPDCSMCIAVECLLCLYRHRQAHLRNGNAPRRHGFAAVMKLLGHTSPRMTMRYVDVTLTDLQREFELARSKPRHLAPQPKTSLVPCAQESMDSSTPYSSLNMSWRCFAALSQTVVLAIGFSGSQSGSSRSSPR